MKFHVLTLFPEMIRNGMNTSITGRAINAGILSVEAINIRDYAFNKHQKVDDYTYGGGAGMLMQAEPVYLAYEAIAEKAGKRPRVVYLTPQGHVHLLFTSILFTLTGNRLFFRDAKVQKVYDIHN